MKIIFTHYFFKIKILIPQIVHLYQIILLKTFEIDCTKIRHILI